jgi:hypothetical protein
MYEVYSEAEKRFMKFDDLDEAKALVDAEATTDESATTDDSTTKPYRTVEPDLYVVKIDETKNWADSILDKIKEHDTEETKSKIFGVYLVDKAEVTHLASLEGSLYLYWLYNIVELGDNADVQEVFEEDELADIELRNGGNFDDADMYVSEHYKFDKEIKASAYDNEQYPDAMETEQGYKEYIDHMKEYYNGNHVF